MYFSHSFWNVVNGVCACVWICECVCVAVCLSVGRCVYRVYVYTYWLVLGAMIVYVCTCVYTLTMCGHIHVRLPHCTHIRTFFSFSCVDGLSCQIHACMHPCSHIYARTHTTTRKNSTVNEYTRTNTNALAYTRDTDRQTVLVMCAAGFSVLLSLLFVADSAIRIDFDGTHLQAKPSICFLSLFFQQRKETKKKRNPTWACAMCLNLL